MPDPIDDLESILETSIESIGNPDLLPLIYRAVDRVRHSWGGNRAYIAKRSLQRRYDQIVQMSESGMKPSEIANKTGMSVSQIYRVRAKTSSCL